jgi:predicted DCC family thiol-disulfide oxidoreductase YuxK
MPHCRAGTDVGRRPVSERPTLRILFDGDCGLCAGTVRFFLRHEARARFVFTPIRSVLGSEIAGQIGLDPDDPASFAVIEADGAVHLRSRGMFLALGQCRQPWRALAGLARLVPERLADAAYDVVARNRIRWFGRSDICQRPAPEVLTRLEMG